MTMPLGSEWVVTGRTQCARCKRFNRTRLLEIEGKWICDICLITMLLDAHPKIADEISKL